MVNGEAAQALGQPVTGTVRRARSNSAGSRNSTFSSMPGSTDTSTGPRRRSAAMTLSTNSSGAEAPAVIPTTEAALTHAASSSLPSAMR